ncbi:MAG: glycosyltransferase [Sedimentisphaerales bacterium]|nr:glycosyltransferase [Sedimentisphaerales bacterium]
MNETDLISIVIPVFNEQVNLEKLLKRCVKTCRSIGKPFELILVDDGSSDQGSSFIRVDAGKISGRCETGFPLYFNPIGKGLAFFMLDGPSGYTLDGGKTWEAMAANQRGWGCGSVDFSAKKPVSIFALRHECGGEIYTSNEMGKTWKLKGKAFASVGIFDAKTFVATIEKEQGIFRTTDGAESWTKVSDLQPAGRDIRVLKGLAYSTSAEGMPVSKDRGAMWAVQGEAVKCSLGPYVGKSQMHIVVGKKGFFQAANGGRQWKQAAPRPPQYNVTIPGWFLNLGWDPHADISYASRTGEPPYKYQK